MLPFDIILFTFGKDQRYNHRLQYQLFIAWYYWLDITYPP